MKTYKETKGSDFVDKNALLGNSRSANFHILKCQTANVFIFSIVDLRVLRTMPFIVDDVFWVGKVTSETGKKVYLQFHKICDLMYAYIF